MTAARDMFGEERRLRLNAREGSERLRKALMRAMRNVAKTAPRRKPRPIYPPCKDVATIQRAVASYFGIDAEWMTQQCRKANLAHPRQVAMFLAREQLGKSYPFIGRQFQRDHTTVIHAYRTVANDPDLLSHARAIRAIAGVSRG